MELFLSNMRRVRAVMMNKYTDENNEIQEPGEFFI